MEMSAGARQGHAQANRRLLLFGEDVVERHGGYIDEVTGPGVKRDRLRGPR